MPSRSRATQAKSGRRTFTDQLRELIRRRQRDYNLSNHAIAQAAGVDHSSYARFLAGDRVWTLDTAGRVAEVLGIGLVELRGGPPDLVPRLAPRAVPAQAQESGS